MINILLTSAGRRNYLVDYFKEALKPYNGKVFVLNSDPNSSALWSSEQAGISPLIYSEEYIPFLLDFCLKNEIKLVVSLFDIELPVLSRYKEAFKEKGITIVVCDTWVAEMANDKKATVDFFKQHKFPWKEIYRNPDEYLLNQNSFPVFIKPRRGMGSIGLHKAENEEELRFYFNKSKKEVFNSYLKYESEKEPEFSVILQEALSGEEYGLDVINDLNGNYQNTVVKKKLQMRSGETDCATTVDVPILKQLGARLSVLLKHPGNLDVDVFFDGKTPYILELNPRFGGGYPFSHAAGVNLPLAIVKWYLGEEVNSSMLNAKIGVKSIKGITIITDPESY